MGQYKMRVVEYRDAEFLPEELVSVTEAAKMLGMTKPGVISAIERGVLTEIVDMERGYRGRRLLRKEVETMRERRAFEVSEKADDAA